MEKRGGEQSFLPPPRRVSRLPAELDSVFRSSSLRCGIVCKFRWISISPRVSPLLLTRPDLEKKVFFFFLQASSTSELHDAMGKNYAE